MREAGSGTGTGPVPEDRPRTCPGRITVRLADHDPGPRARTPDPVSGSEPLRRAAGDRPLEAVVAVLAADPGVEVTGRGRGLPTAALRIGHGVEEHLLGLLLVPVEVQVPLRQQGPGPRQVGEHPDRPGGQRLPVLQAVRLVGRGRQEGGGVGQPVPVVLAGRHRADPGPLLPGDPHRLLGDQVLLLQPHLHGDRGPGRDRGHHPHEEVGPLAGAQGDGRVQHHRDLGGGVRTHPLQVDAEVLPADHGPLRECRDGPGVEHLAHLVRGPFGVGEGREQPERQAERCLPDGLGVLGHVLPDEVHHLRPARPLLEHGPDQGRVEDVHVDHDGVVAVDELQRLLDESAAAPGLGPDQDRVGEQPEQPADQGGTGAPADDVAVGVDQRLVAEGAELDRDLLDRVGGGLGRNGHRAHPSCTRPVGRSVGTASDGTPRRGTGSAARAAPGRSSPAAAGGVPPVTRAAAPARSAIGCSSGSSSTPVSSSEEVIRMP
ncbi:hypothetical protein SDC9_60828 [bioreactor metagenome]|uniref:Uncharacterized protein n=1 Tax=bioreactor metagenome TaxID=1076179 RepID=A0A644XE42_9ZZZZ